MGKAKPMNPLLDLPLWPQASTKSFLSSKRNKPNWSSSPTTSNPSKLSSTYPPCAEKWMCPTASSKANPDLDNWSVENNVLLLLSPMSNLNTRLILPSWWKPFEPTIMPELILSENLGVVD